MSSILEGSSLPQPNQSGSSLFSNIGTPQSQQQSSSNPGAFSGSGGGGGGGGGGGSNRPPPLNLFGGLNAKASNNQQQSGTGNLFSATSVTQGQQQQSSTRSSLFGSTSQAQQQPSSGGLFGGAGQSQPQQQQSAPAASGSLFPGIGQSQSQPQQQQQQPSLFSNAGGNQHQQSLPQTQRFGGSLLGGSTLFGESTAGNQSTYQSRPQVAQQDEQKDAAEGAPSQRAYFDNLLERGKKRHHSGNGTNQLGDLPSLQLGLGDISSKIRNLGGAASTRPQHRGGDTRAEYLLAASGVSTGSTLRDLKAFSAEAGVAPATSQSAPLDTDIDGYLAKEREKSTLDLIAETIEDTKRDFDAFLEEHVQMNWDEQRQRIYEHFGLAKPAESLNASSSAIGTPAVSRGAFGRSSRRVKDSLRADSSPASMTFGASSMSKSVLGGSLSRGNSHTSLFTDVNQRSPSTGLQSAPEDRSLRSKQERYAAKVKELNSARLQEIVYPVIQKFASVEMESGNDTSPDLIEAYKALKEITKEKGNAHRPSEPGAIKERQYARDYLDEASNSGRSLSIRKQVVDGSRYFLEYQFFQQMEELVSRNPKEANLGGVPSKINKVRAYLRIRSARKDLGADNLELQLLDDDYCWALIFYMLRCGLIQEAAQYVADNERALKSMDRNFGSYMAAYARSPDRRLPRDMQNRIYAEYQQRARLAPDNSIDPYRMACYKVVGRCDLSKKNLDGIQTSMQDWVWLIFSLAREVNRVDESAADVFGLEEIRLMIEDIGQRHFQQNAEGSGSYATYFFLQILAGMFEQAISWLYPHNYVVAVHFAIALDFYGLLRVSDFNVSETDLLTYTTRQKPQISFGRLMGYYTRDFRMARAEAAADYLTLICLNADLPAAAGQSQVSVCHEALKELVLETREFAQLLGDVRSDGQRIRGVIEQRLNLVKLRDQDDFLKTLTLQAASVANDNGRTTDAVLLYHLAEDYDNVIAIVNRALSDTLAVDIGQEEVRLQPLKPRASLPKQNGSDSNSTFTSTSLSLTSVDDPATLAQNMLSLYSSNAAYYSHIRVQNRTAAHLLLRLSTAKTLTTSSKYPQALDAIRDLDLLPMRANANISIIRASAQAFNALPAVVSRIIGPLLMWTINCCASQRAVLRAGVYEDRARIQMAEELLGVAKDLMVFAGLIRYRLPPRVYESLARAGQDVGFVHGAT